MFEFCFIYGGLVLLGPLLGWAESRARRDRGSLDAALDAERLAERIADRRQDIVWWLISPLLTGTLTRGTTLGLWGLVLMAADKTPQVGATLIHGTRALPFLLQLIAALLVADAVGYWSHRLRHLGLWRFHRIHHGPRALFALSAARMHPIDELIDGVVIGFVLLLLGFDWRIFAFVGPIVLLYTLLSHADLDLSFGHLRWLLVSPRFHRWHHARQFGPRGANYAAMFSFFDLIFGTFYLPPYGPEALGTEPPVPRSLGGQLLAPFQRARR
ncbi:MAG: sterol desaturase family protein [Deltaproteobacteria bacterium]|nr:sterol desaturase family protein [Deltaproteobacteria bacterium]